MPKREPALWIGALGAILSLLVGFGVPGLSDGLAVAITAFVTAGVAAWTAAHTTPVLPTLFSGVISTGAVLAAALGWHLTQHQVSLTAAAMATIVSLIARAQITPVNSQSAQLRL